MFGILSYLSIFNRQGKEFIQKLEAESRELGGQFKLAIRGQFKLARGGHFELAQRGQYAVGFPDKAKETAITNIKTGAAGASPSIETTEPYSDCCTSLSLCMVKPLFYDTYFSGHFPVTSAEEIEHELGFNLNWQNLPNSKASRITLSKTNINIEDEADKKEAYKWLLDNATNIYI